MDSGRFCHLPTFNANSIVLLSGEWHALMPPATSAFMLVTDLLVSDCMFQAAVRRVHQRKFRNTNENFIVACFRSAASVNQTV